MIAFPGRSYVAHIFILTPKQIALLLSLYDIQKGLKILQLFAMILKCYDSALRLSGKTIASYFCVL